MNEMMLKLNMIMVCNLNVKSLFPILKFKLGRI